MKLNLYNITAVLALVACLLSACSNGETTHKYVAPCQAGFDVDNLNDCTVPARFSANDFNWMGGNLTMTVFSEDIYDAVEVTQLMAGDTLLYDGERIVVDSIAEESGSIITINGGLEQGGAWLQAYEGGTYRGIQFDDHSMYTEQGKVQVALAQDFVLVDCGDNPTDPDDTIRSNQKLYLENVKEYKKDFNELNTRVQIEGGQITMIHRRWIP